MKQLAYLITALLSLQLSIAQNTTTNIEMLASNWNVPKDATFEIFDNRETLLLTSGRATANNQKFKNGTIEVDVYANSVRSFAGITFRKQEHNMEEVYMRLHKSNQVDAVQYTPIFNNESSWQLFREYQARVNFKNKGWNALRIEVDNTSAEVFVNDKKVMSIDHLRTNQNAGEIGLFALFSNRFSNFRFTPKKMGNSETVNRNPIDPNIITKWDITKAKPYKEGALHFDDFSKEKYSTVTTEKSGLLPISKYLKKTSSGNFEENTEDYTIASTTIHSNNGETKLFTFDYSDKIIVYLNGKVLFKGNNAFRAKGIQYMGHIDINVNKLYLPLKKGENKLHCVVIDKANGWGLIAKLE
ncbi:MAG: hypothetical protein COA50_07890 [Flavobacteriaceae bacterium]|nr:MAG: hypothetical protein COA50_07890 [Flavobacteriaceae bacterium]